MEQGYRQIDNFVSSTKEVLFLRRDDSLLIIRPNKIQHLNATAFDMLEKLYAGECDAKSLVRDISKRYRKPEELIFRDLSEIINSVGAIMKEDYAGITMASTIPYSPDSLRLPVLSEIALTYRCQNRCDFCYASSPYRGSEVKEISTPEVKRVIDKIKDEAKVPTLSFTGGEPTLRTDLPELISYASAGGLRTNLISNGIACADRDFVQRLGERGLHSAQISLEGHTPSLHDSITGNPGSFEATTAGIDNLKHAEIHVHTNTTVCSKNHRFLIDLCTFIRNRFDTAYLSMNMIITTGTARDNDNIDFGYSKIGEIIEPVIEHCRDLGLKFVWYSPTPYCLFNPVDYGLGAKSCACVSGLLSINPAGEVLPCSSYSRGIGSMLNQPFSKIWESDQALYFRERRYIPPVCKSCDYTDICGGACPLYWEHAGGFGEIEKLKGNTPRLRNCMWKLEKKLRVTTGGTGGNVERGRL